MSSPAADRRLAAIVSADVVGYSRLMSDDEDATVRTLAAYREEVSLLVRHHRGRLVDFTGDNWLAEFPTASAAVVGGLEIQGVLKARNARLPAERRMEFRIGVHLGEVRAEGKRLYGDGVNVAARLQTLAEPGGICVSAAVRDQLGSKLAVSWRDLGEQSLKNIPDPVRAYQIQSDAPAAATGVGRRRRPLFAAASIALVAAAIVAAWRLLPPLASRVSSPGPIRSLAVLPLENLSGDPEQEYFADGMTETLIGDLGKIGELKVISRTSVMQYKGTKKPLPQIAAELGVDALLEGTVTRERDRVRVTAQLIDGRTDHHVWAERYDRDLRGVLELQSDVARAVAREIEFELSPAEASQLANRPPVDPAAHDALLQGIYQLSRWTPESLKAALASFERAIELDPGYAEAHALLGSAWASLAYGDQIPEHIGLPKARSAALRALELDDSIAEAHRVLGWVALLSWDWPESERHLQRALELNPSLPLAHTCLGYHMVSRGRSEEAIAEGRRGVELDPFNLTLRSGLVEQYRFAHRYDDALAEGHKILEMDPTFPTAHFQLGLTYLALGRYEEAIGAWEGMGMKPENVALLRAALLREGPQGYRHESLRLSRANPNADNFHWLLAAQYAALGERDEAFAELERAYAARDGDLAFLRVWSAWDPIRDDPRFADLVRRIGIPES